MSETSYQADVVVAGAGIAGMVTALELLRGGRKVLLLERDERAGIGGLARWAFGGMFFVDSPVQRKGKIKDTVELALSDWRSFAEFSQEDEAGWPGRWAEQFIHFTTPHGYRWLHEQGIRFFPVVHWVERGLQRPGNSVPRFHLLWGTGAELVKVIDRHLEVFRESGALQEQFRHRVQELLTEEGAVTGVSGIDEETGRPFRALGEYTVVAAGGINGSIERVKENWPKAWGEAPEIILNGSHPYGVGDLHDAASRIEAQVTHLDWQWNYAAGVRHPKPRMPEHGLSLVPCKSALWLNYRGERLGPMPLITGFDTRYLVERICQEPKKYSWQVLNRRIAYKEFAISGSEHNPAVRDKKLLAFLKTVLLGNRKLVEEMLRDCEDFVVAHSIEELAEKMNALTLSGDVDPRLLRESIQQYDALINQETGRNTDEQLRRIGLARQYRGDRMRTCNFQKIDDPKAGPLIAIREFILSRKTLGGIQTDLECRVLNRSDLRGGQNPIPGLYAVGEAAGFGGGGMHGLRSLEGTFLAGCVITARVAARSILGGRFSA